MMMMLDEKKYPKTTRDDKIMMYEARKSVN